MGSLILVATPIGNLGDISLRAVQTLKDADLILCEDTRVTSKLLKAYNVSTPTQVLHDHNEEDRIPSLIRRLQEGQTLALVSDAGTPLVSDPGFRFVRAALSAGFKVSATPGANAATLALTLSGLPPHPFLFNGFAAPRQAARLTQFSSLHAAEKAGLRATHIWYEAPHRLTEMLTDLMTVFGPEREGAVGRELTKRFEEMRRGTLSELFNYFLQNHPRGEFTVLLGPQQGSLTASDEEIDCRLRDALATHSVKDAAQLVAGAVGLPRQLIYARALAVLKG